jgi:hypothetical protein
MSENNNDVRHLLRALAKAVPQEASPSAERYLLVRFRERRNQRKRWTYLAAIAASLAIGFALYVARWHHQSATVSVSPTGGDQTSGFITLPYAQSGVPLEQAVIVRVNIPVSELGIIGVPFTPTSPNESIPAELLIGQDGVARAVRFVE